MVSFAIFPKTYRKNVNHRDPTEKQVTRADRVEAYGQEFLTEHGYNQICDIGWGVLRSHTFSPHPPNTCGSRNC